MKQWYKQLGLSKDPFRISPYASREQLFGREKEIADVVYHIRSGNMLFVAGHPGVGKTMLLMAALRQFPGRIIYLDGAQLQRELDIERVLVNKYGFVRGRLLGKKPKQMILMLDNVARLSRLNTERIKYFFDMDYLSAVVFAAESLEQSAMSASLRQRIGTRVITLAPLSDELVVELVAIRIKDHVPFSHELIRQVYAATGRNLAETLAYLSRITEQAVARQIDLASLDLHQARVFFGERDAQ